MATATDSDVYCPDADPSDDAILEELTEFDRPNVLVELQVFSCEFTNPSADK